MPSAFGHVLAEDPSDALADFGMFEYFGGRRKLERVLADDPAEGEPQKPAVLYVHGWQPGAYQTPGENESFLTSKEDYGEETDVAERWINIGYRVLVFLWVPFADELDVFKAEQKIWTAGGGGQPARREDGRWRSVPGVAALGAELFEACRRCPQIRNAARLHLVGHSLGCQMVTHLLQLILAAAPGEMPLPQRVTLLDPYFSNFSKSYLGGKWVGEVVRDVARLAAEKGVAIEQVKSSEVLENWLSDTNEKLRQHTASFVLDSEKLFPLAYGPGDIGVVIWRHAHARFVYFASLSGRVTVDVLGAEDPGGPAEPQPQLEGLADRTDAEVRRLMSVVPPYVQVGASRPWKPNALVFKRGA